MPRRRHDGGLFDELYATLLLMPIWVGPVLAAAAYVALRFGWPVAFGGKEPAQAMPSGIGPAIAPWISLVIIGVWIFAEFRKWQRRRLLDDQTSLESIRRLSWQEFEHVVGEAYRRQDYIVEETGTASGDGGIDLVLSGRCERVLVQCKRWRERRVGVKPVRELYGVLASEAADRALLVTCGSFTDEAAAFARGKPLKLVSGDELLDLVRSGQQTETRDKPVADIAAIPASATGTAAIPSPPVCPKCGQAMVLRTAKRGPKAGSQFWGCVNYPRCRVTSEHRGR